MEIKFAKDIVADIEKRSKVSIPKGCVTGEAFEEWLRIEGFNMKKCRNCEKIKYLMNEDGIYQWCDEIIDCPDLDMERNCKMFDSGYY